MSDSVPRKLLPIEELITRFGGASEVRTFDEKHAVSYRTWLAIANYVAYHDPRLLNRLFQGIEFPDMRLDTGDVSFSLSLEEAMMPDAKAKYTHLKLNVRHYGSMQTRLRLFQNIVEATGDPYANFLVGRNIRINREMGALKSTFQTGAKGLLKILGTNPAKILEKRMPDANRALNSFLDTRVVQYGPSFMDVRVEYFRQEDLSAEGDHYTLGTILGGLETIGAYKDIKIQALQSPFNEEREKAKENITQPGVKYSSVGYHYCSESPVFLYRYTFHEQAQFLRRVARALGDIVRQRLPSRLTRQEMRQEEARRHLLEQEQELDTRAKREYETRLTAEKARADAAEARLTLEQQVSGVNEVFGEINMLAHDSKNAALMLIKGKRKLLEEILRAYPSYARLLGDIFLDDNTLEEGLNHIQEDAAAPYTLQLVAAYVQQGLKNSLLIFENERRIMGGGTSINIEEIAYTDVLDKVLYEVAPLYPMVKIRYTSPEGMHMQGDLRLLRVAFTNLIDNAMGASKPDGFIEITQTQKRGAERLFTIIDIVQSGYLAPEYEEKLNEGEGFTTKADGNATGAKASYRIIKDTHKGSIRYRSLGEQGARVTIKI